MIAARPRPTLRAGVVARLRTPTAVLTLAVIGVGAAVSVAEAVSLTSAPPSPPQSRSAALVEPLDDTALSYLAQTRGVAPRGPATGLPAPAGGATGSVAGVAGAPVTPGALLELPSGPLGIPGAVLVAYRTVADELAVSEPGCRMSWSLLAGIGRIESGHASGGRVDAAGTTLGPILGPVLDGSGPGDGVVLDTDHGRLDGNTVYDRAVGPMQFIPGTWAVYGADGNGDGVADPNNVYDAALGAGRYLCSGGLDVSDPVQARTAVFRYDHSDAYVTNVLAWAAAYSRGVAPTASELGPVPPPVDHPAPAPAVTSAAPAPTATPSAPVAPAPTTAPPVQAPAPVAPAPVPPAPVVVTTTPAPTTPAPTTASPTTTTTPPPAG